MAPADTTAHNSTIEVHTVMNRLLETWATLTTRQRMTALGAVLLTLLGIAALGQAASRPRMALLYAGLDAATAGEALTAMEGMDVATEVRGDAIYVEATARDEVRMALAADGLPRQGQAGFELLDSLNGFATTAEAFDAAYWRAKEGELARTILASPGVRSARVHIAAAPATGFSRSAPAPSAVVTASMARGRLSPEQATAMRYLVALAVPRLAPDQVAIIDAGYGVVLAPGDPQAAVDTASDSAERERNLERDITALIEARVGVGNVRARVTLDIDRDAETVSERIIDPGSRTIVDRDATEMSESGSGGVGPVTVASNLPEGDAGAATPQSRSQRSETRETTKFDLSEVRRERSRLAGGVRRAHVAVLVNHVAASDGKEATPRSPEELAALRKLVEAAVGFDAARGDVVTLESLPFESTGSEGTVAEQAGVVDFLRVNAISILQIVVPAVVVILLSLFVIRPLLAPSRPVLDAGDAGVVATTSINAIDAHLTPASAVDDARLLAAEKKDASARIIRAWLTEAEPVR